MSDFENDYRPEFFMGIAHRGLHNEEVSENGLGAFKAAIDHNLAFELDVHLTKDNKLVVVHDSDLKRVTGRPGIVEDLSFNEIRDHYRLMDGETIPSLKEVIDLNASRRLIVLELKVYKNNYSALAKKVKEETEGVDPKGIVLISFDPRALLSFGNKFKRSLLVCKAKDWVLNLAFLFDSLDVETSLVKDPKVIRARKKGKSINVWTVEDEMTLKEVLPYVDTVTFQKLDYRFVLEEMKKKR